MNNSQVSGRNSAVEALRVLAMLCIVLSHACVHSGLSYTYGELSLNRLFLQCGCLGKLGVMVFVLISGYFLCSKPFRIQSLSKLFSQVWFYSLAMFLVCRFLLGVEYSTRNLLRAFLPTVYGAYWFFTAYFLLLILTPLVNGGIAAMTQRQHRALILVLTVCWTLIPTVTQQMFYGDEIPLFLLCYLIGAYFRIYPENIFRRKLVSWGLTLGSFLALLAVTLLFVLLERRVLVAHDEASWYYSKNSILILGAAVGMLAIAVNTKPFYSRFINILGGCTFGVYLIHDNPPMRRLLWQDWFYHGDYYTSGSFILRMLLSVAIVYAVCTAIEFLRQKTLARPMENALNRVLQKLFPM